jgi:hypothetical protein
METPKIISPCLIRFFFLQPSTIANQYIAEDSHQKYKVLQNHIKKGLVVSHVSNRGRGNSGTGRTSGVGSSGGVEGGDVSVLSLNNLGGGVVGVRGSSRSGLDGVGRGLRSESGGHVLISN